MIDGLKHLVFHIHLCKSLVFHVSGSCFPVHLKSLQCFCVCDLAVEVSMSLTWCWLASLVPPELSSCVCVATTQGDEATNQVPPGLCKYRPKWRFWSRVRNKQVDVEKHCLSPLLWVLVICLPPCSLLPNLLSQTAAPGSCWWGTSCTPDVSSHLHYFSLSLLLSSLLLLFFNSLLLPVLTALSSCSLWTLLQQHWGLLSVISEPWVQTGILNLSSVLNVWYLLGVENT